jgi:hypothetical protein
MDICINSNLKLNVLYINVIFTITSYTMLHVCNMWQCALVNPFYNFVRTAWKWPYIMAETCRNRPYIQINENRAECIIDCVYSSKEQRAGRGLHVTRQSYLCGPREFSNTFNWSSTIRMDNVSVIWWTSHVLNLVNTVLSFNGIRDYFMVTHRMLENYSGMNVKIRGGKVHHPP